MVGQTWFGSLQILPEYILSSKEMNRVMRCHYPGIPCLSFELIIGTNWYVNSMYLDCLTLSSIIWACRGVHLFHPAYRLDYHCIAVMHHFHDRPYYATMMIRYRCFYKKFGTVSMFAPESLSFANLRDGASFTYAGLLDGVLGS